MRDLKHLIYFENLLQEANNDLVKQAKDEGKLALGYTCYFMPEVLLDLPGCFSVRLRAPRCTSPDMATYYMSSRTCHYGRSLLERALEGGFNFLDAQLATETCTVTCRFQEHLQRMQDVIQNERFKCSFMDVPFKKTQNAIDHYEEQLRAHVLDFLRDNYGVDTSDEALLKTIEAHNEVCRLVQEIGEYRKLDNPTITGYEFAVITLATMTCPKELIIDKLQETAEEMRTRQPDAKRNSAARWCWPAARTTILTSSSSSRAAAPAWWLTAIAMARPRPPAHRDQRRRDAPARHRPPLSADQPVHPLHGAERDASPQAGHRRHGKGIQGRRHHHRLQQVLRVLEL